MIQKEPVVFLGLILNKTIYLTLMNIRKCQRNKYYSWHVYNL